MSIESVLWKDDGPYSQGKVITAILQNREDDAREILRSWAFRDLVSLVKAAEKLATMATQEAIKRR